MGTVFKNQRLWIEIENERNVRANRLAICDAHCQSLFSPWVGHSDEDDRPSIASSRFFSRPFSSVMFLYSGALCTKRSK